MADRIASGAYINQIAGTSLEANRCPPKGLIESTGEVIVAGTYTSNQLIPETSIIKKGLHVNTKVVIVNFGPTAIGSITVQFTNHAKGVSSYANTGGGFANGSSRTTGLDQYVYGEGSGNIAITSVTINGVSIGGSQISSKTNLRVNTSSSNLPLPSTWGNISLATHYFVNSTVMPQSYIQMDINW